MKIDTKQKVKKQMQAMMWFAILILLTISIKTPALPLILAPLVEITEVKNVGVSASNDTKSIIQAQWSVNTQLGINIKSFELVLEVVYADGGVEKLKATANGTERKARFEVPTLHISAGKPGAELRSFKTNITTIFTETATKQGNF